LTAANDSGSTIALGDLVVRRGGSATTMIRVMHVGPARTVSVRRPRMESVLSGIYVQHGGLRSVDDLPTGVYRHATELEVAAAREQGTVPPAIGPDSAPFE
jgi:hypothetical protein